MAQTGSQIAQTGKDLAHLGSAVHGYDDATVNLIMATVARDCQTNAEKTLFLARCEAEGLSPIRQEIYAVRRSGKITFVLSYLACISRAAQAGYDLVSSNAVCENDTWDGWDAVASTPVKHIVLGGSRGPVTGAYAIWSLRSTGERRGWFWSGKEVFPDSPLAGSLGEHLAAKNAIGRSARLLVPSLMTSIYLAEELGYKESEASLEKIVAPVEREIKDVKDVVEISNAQVPATKYASPDRVSHFLADEVPKKIKNGEELMNWSSEVLGRNVTTFAKLTIEEMNSLETALEAR